MAGQRPPSGLGAPGWGILNCLAVRSGLRCRWESIHGSGATSSRSSAAEPASCHLSRSARRLRGLSVVRRRSNPHPLDLGSGRRLARVQIAPQPILRWLLSTGVPGLAIGAVSSGSPHRAQSLPPATRHDA
jgi:hypothetical protein